MAQASSALSSPHHVLGRLIRRLVPRQFAIQLALFNTLMLVASIGGHTLYTVFEQLSWQEKQLVQGTQRLLSNLAATTTEHLLTRNYSGMERMLLLSANQRDILTLSVINRNEQVISQVKHSADGADPEAVFDFVTLRPPADNAPMQYWVDSNGNPLPGKQFDWQADRLVLWHSLSNMGYSGFLRAEVSTSELKDTLLHIVRDGIFMALLACAISVGLLFAYLRHPIATIRASSRFAGELTNKLGEHMPAYQGPQEIESLVTALNDTSFWLYTKEMSVSAANQRLEAVFGNISDALLTLNADGMIESANPAASVLFFWYAATLDGHACGRMPSRLGQSDRRRCAN